MGRVIILGSANAVPDLKHENTHLLVQAGHHTILVDCPGTPMVRLQQAGVDPIEITDLILTHFHPDHVSGLASLLMSLWLVGRKQPLTVYGLEATIDRAEKMMDLYNWKQWPGFYPVEFKPIPSEENALVWADEEVSVWASPVQHLIPTIGLRFEFHQEHKKLVYSCDTEPSDAVVRLADQVDVLIHEATGNSTGHTSPEKAGEIAAQSGAKSLYLIHYPAALISNEMLLARAGQAYQGPLFVAEDFLTIPIAAAE